MTSNVVARVSVWRAREVKRKDARDRDHKRIIDLEAELHMWRQWWQTMQKQMWYGQPLEKVVPVPQVSAQEQVEPVPRMVTQEVVKTMPVPQVNTVEKIVADPQMHSFGKVQTKKRVVPVPQPHVQEVVADPWFVGKDPWQPVAVPENAVEKSLVVPEPQVNKKIVEHNVDAEPTSGGTVTNNMADSMPFDITCKSWDRKILVKDTAPKETTAPMPKASKVAPPISERKTNLTRFDVLGPHLPPPKWCPYRKRVAECIARCGECALSLDPAKPAWCCTTCSAWLHADDDCERWDCVKRHTC